MGYGVGRRLGYETSMRAQSLRGTANANCAQSTPLGIPYQVVYVFTGDSSVGAAGLCSRSAQPKRVSAGVAQRTCLQQAMDVPSP